MWTDLYLRLLVSTGISEAAKDTRVGHWVEEGRGSEVVDLPIPSEPILSQIPSNQNIAREWCDCFPSANF